MSIINQNLYLIIQQLDNFVPDDIKHKILLLLLGMDNNWTQKICLEFQKKIRNNPMLYGQQYEIRRPQENQVQYLIMCEIKIAQFDASAPKKKSSGAVKNIQKYMNLLDARFKIRHQNLF